MKIGIPIEEDRGLQSPVCPHFGSAPGLLVVDTVTRSCEELDKSGVGHGNCGSVNLLPGAAVEVLLVGGIGPGALNKLAALGIRVYPTQGATVGEALDAFARGQTAEYDRSQACGHHGHDHGHTCGH